MQTKFQLFYIVDACKQNFNFGHHFQRNMCEASKIEFFLFLYILFQFQWLIENLSYLNEE